MSGEHRSDAPTDDLPVVPPPVGPTDEVDAAAPTGPGDDTSPTGDVGTIDDDVVAPSGETAADPGTPLVGPPLEDSDRLEPPVTLEDPGRVERPPTLGAEDPLGEDARDEVGLPIDAVPAIDAGGAAGADPGTAVPREPVQGSAWGTLLRALRPRVSRAQVLAAVLCALLGFAVVVQVRQTNTEGLASLRQSDLVRILDETTRRAAELEREAAALERTRQELLTGSDQQQAALDAATKSATTLGILSGRLPAEGPGIELTISDSSGSIEALTLFNVLEELRNAGAEAVQVNDQRLVASSYFIDTARGVEVDGVVITPPYRWIAVGDPDAIGPALEIPGGAMAVVRTAGGRGAPVARDRVEVTATRTVTEPRFATPAPAGTG
ncbi:DUF881 domain-containing protein [Cellulomonas fimi]|uniref:DUF881 domain-containing protein n=1 Tax=Cellulomonas fimi TaxID=1708 RepID=A0A7Y0M0H2_CELFI|nr:DUF881 domain-containing protein [Cellulomonas fimi]NMR21552.1 DUF881 domain-containing protein [Cellulomonas fimi]